MDESVPAQTRMNLSDEARWLRKSCLLSYLSFLRTPESKTQHILVFQWGTVLMFVLLCGHQPNTTKRLKNTKSCWNLAWVLEKCDLDVRVCRQAWGGWTWHESDGGWTLVLKVRECLQEGHWASARKTTTERPGGQCEGRKGNVCVCARIYVKCCVYVKGDLIQNDNRKVMLRVLKVQGHNGSCTSQRCLM